MRILRRAIYLLVGVFLFSAFAAFNTTPPFNECPAIGSDTGCAILFVFNSNGTVTGSADVSQGPYDGVEDTLVGVLNNSSVTQTGLTLDGGTVTIFGFDGDGLCTFTFTGSSFCGTTADTTGYGGPNVTFSGINAGFTKGTVNFTGGLAPGAATYFSLEEAISASAIPTGTVSTVPAPRSLVLLLTGLGIVALYQGRRLLARLTA